MNIAVFDGVLYEPTKISIKQLHLKNKWAYCHGQPVDKTGIKRVTVTFAATFRDRRTFLNAIVHEMVHCWEYQMHTTMGHRKRFYLWGPRISDTVGLHLSLSI